MERVFSAFTVGGKTQYVGSYFDTILWPSDIDLLEIVESDKSPQRMALQYSKKLQSMIQRISHIPSVRITNIHFAIDWKLDDFLQAQVKELAALLQRPSTKIKIDLVVWVNEEARFREMSKIFVFKSKHHAMNWQPSSLQEDVKAYLQKRDYWKVVKRLYSITKLKNNVRLVTYLKNIFNGELGALSSLISELRTIELLGQSTSIPRAKVFVELRGIQLRLQRIAELMPIKSQLMKAYSHCFI